ncbi:MAG: DNA repair protein RecN, partial [Actinomycetota bacterium]|nr:DNA repair protein RecN [Actinomycetota bacterium]
ARLAYFRSQVAEIDAANIAVGEDDALAAEAALLHCSAERTRLAAEAHTVLEGADESVAAVLASLQRRLDRLADLDPDLNRAPERLTSARYEIEDLGRELGRYSEGVEHDPGRLAAVEARRDLLERLKRKHGSMLEDVFERARAMSEEVDLLETRATRGAESEREEARLRNQLSELAGRLADAREAAADRLEVAVRGRLAELGMGEGTFEVDLSRRTNPAGVEWSGERYAWTRGGLESVVFRISPNAGEAPHPLSQIASGGELSRVLLALKAALAEVDRTPTLIFDEIDAGIGGVVAHHVARQLAAVASHHQVIVVTHLAQIAAVAEQHLVVEKKPAGGRTVSVVRLVTGEERVRELSRLLGGDPERKVSRHHARELLKGRV